MKNIIEICKDFGIEIPAEKHADFLKAVNVEYKTVSDYQKQVDKTTAATQRAETAEEALKGFEGLTPDKMKEQLEEANRKVKEAQDNAVKQIAERDFTDALNAELANIKFTSAAAKKAVEADIRAADLKLKDGKILGLSDLIEQMKKADASAFVDEEQEVAEVNKPRFTASNGAAGNPGSKKKLSDMSLDERIKLKASNPTLYNKLRKGE